MASARTTTSVSRPTGVPSWARTGRPTRPATETSASDKACNTRVWRFPLRRGRTSITGITADLPPWMTNRSTVTPGPTTLRLKGPSQNLHARCSIVLTYHSPRRAHACNRGRGARQLRRLRADPRFRRPHPVSYTHLRAHETVLDLVCRLLL